MAHHGRQSADEQLRLALACGATIETAANRAGVSVRTAYRRLRNPEFRRQVRELRAEIVQRTSSALSAASSEAVKTLIALQQAAQPAGVRLGAAKAILEIGIRLREITELEERISELESRVSGET